jgi:hypothetical protein
MGALVDIRQVRASVDPNRHRRRRAVASFFERKLKRLAYLLFAVDWVPPKPPPGVCWVPCGTPSVRI